jgi:hypothetical protein
MALLKLNQVEFKVIEPNVSIWLSNTELPHFKKKNISFFSSSEFPDEWSESTELYYAFSEDENSFQSTINLEEQRYFLKPYIDYLLNTYFTGQNLITNKSFIDSLEIWLDKGKKGVCHEYDRFSVKVTDIKSISKIRLLITFDKRTLVHGKSLTEYAPQNHYSKYVFGKKIYSINSTPVANPSKSFPVINNILKKELGIPFEGFSRKNTYKEYYQKISEFFDKYLKGKIIGNNIQFYSEGFVDVEQNKIFKTKSVSNYLKFNNGNDYNVHNGLKTYGPYQAPNTDNLRFIFIYTPDQKDYANALYSYLRKGLGGFPGLNDYVKVKFVLANENKIILESDNHIEELKQKLNAYKFEDGIRYFAIYLTKRKRFDQFEDNDEEYYLIKYALLETGILSQFIYFKNINQSNFSYHLPNISVAILAKIGGIPWKLDTLTSDTLVVGFGVKKNEDQTYLGNTLCFRDDGIFFNFEVYQRADLSSLGDALKQSIHKAIDDEHFKPVKLVIHFYKILSEEEAKEIEDILQAFNLNIPYIVLTINETKSKDYLFFDLSYDGIMPVSGTIIETRQYYEYLIANNNRYSETQSYGISKYPFPIKVKINKSKNSTYDVFDKKTLLDQVYSFSRIYWKSISQVSLPVTISYAKIVADLASNFPAHTLPEIKIAHSNLWFL